MIKLLVASILLLLSLLVVFKAPHYMLWLTAVAITNYPLIFMAATAVMLWLSRTGRFAVQSALLSGVALVLFSLPVITAFIQAGTVRKEMQKIFPVGNTSTIDPPVRFFRLLKTSDKPVYETGTYKIIDGKALQFDFYSSAASSASPLVIVIHGGLWQSGDSRQLPELNNLLAAKGYNVASINYRLAPAYRSPAPVEDTRDAISFFIQHARQYNTDTNNIILLGRSAGAQIALTAAYSLHIPAVKGVISYYGPADMVWGGQIKTNKYVLNTDVVYNDYFGGRYATVPQKFAAASALTYVAAGVVPTLIIHGKTDALVSFQHGVHLQEKLNAAAVPNYFLQIPFATHGCDFNINGPGGQLCTYATEVFLQSITKHIWKN